jgi:hypothetical protein
MNKMRKFPLKKGGLKGVVVKLSLRFTLVVMFRRGVKIQILEYFIWAKDGIQGVLAIPVVNDGVIFLCSHSH